jgi:hypothetical protein
MNTSRTPSVSISEEDKERFFKSVLSDKPYEEVFGLFDNQIKVKFRAMTVSENNDVVNQIVADRKTGLAAENDAYLITITTYRLGLSLISVDDKPYSSVIKDGFTVFAENDSYVLARARPMQSWATAKLAVFLDAFQSFESKLVKLTQEVQNPNFWKASA